MSFNPTFLPHIVAATVLAMGFAAPAGAASIVVTNLDNTGTSETGFGNPIATSFTTGPGPGWTLDAVTLMLQRDPGGSAADTITVRVLSDAAGTPGSFLGSLTGPSIPIDTATPTGFSFAPGGTIDLSEATTYWVVLSDGQTPPGGTTYWSLAGDDSETELTGWSIGDNLLWDSGGWAEANTNPGRMQIVVTQVPEPASAFLLVLGVFGLTARRRRV